MSTNRNWRMLSSDMVLSKNPCDHYRELLIKRYLLRSIEVTVEMAVAQADDWDWYWAAENLLADYPKYLMVVEDLNTRLRAAQEPLRKLVEEAHRPALAEHDKMHAELMAGGMAYWDAYNKADAVYDERMKYVRAARVAVSDLISKERNKEMARLFAEQFIAEGNDTPVDESVDDNVCNCGACQDVREYENED